MGIYKMSAILTTHGGKISSCAKISEYTDAHMNKLPTKLPCLLAVALSLILLPQQGWADKVRVAVASNFAAAIGRVAEQFEAQTGHSIMISSGSTGKHYAQIRQGAPFDIFLAADSHHAQLLEQQGVAKAGSRFTYAVGELVLWSPNSATVDSNILKQENFRYLAIANPRLAPYGRAARQVLKQFDLWNQLSSKIVRGENISQTFQFVHSGNAQLGFIARSQLAQLDGATEGSYWQIPQALYAPIQQQAVLLNDLDAAKAFLAYIKTEQALEIIQGFGYGTP